MKFRLWTYKGLSLTFFIISMLLFILSTVGTTSDDYTEKAASRTAKKIERRLKLMDRLIEQDDCPPEFESSHESRFPEDIVIYRYVNDSLKTWHNQFSVINDDIGAKLEIQRLTNLKSRITSPLAEIGEELTFINLGPKWYLVKSIEKDNGEKIIAGLELQNSLIRDIHGSGNGVNPHLDLSNRLIIRSLHHSEGSAVTINGRPLFKVAYGTEYMPEFFDNALLRWIALVFIAAAAVLFLAAHRTFKAYIAVNIALAAILITALVWGYRMSESSSLFSPQIYADGALLYSLGALLVVNTYVILFNSCAYLIRRRVLSQIRQNSFGLKAKKLVYGIAILAAIICSCMYIHITLESLIKNSSLTLELYRWNTNIAYTALVHLSYFGIFVSILFLMQMLRPAVWKFTGIKFNIFSRKSLTFFAFIWALYMTATAGIFGFRKEEDRVQVWANRLAVDRDLSLEITLRSIEEDIANDQILWSLAAHSQSHEAILNRISEYYLSRIRQAYNLNVALIQEGDEDAMAYFENLINSGTPVSEDSRFLFVRNDMGNNSYAGIFLFYFPDRGMTHLVLEIEPDDSSEDRGYFTFLKRQSKPGAVNIPPIYSYAKYSGGRLISYKGNFPYPTSTATSTDAGHTNAGQKVVRNGGYVHFNHQISDDEMIIISRPSRTGMVYFTAFSYLFLASALLMQIFARGRKRRTFKSNYFRTKINIILFVSSCLILVSMTIISVLFVYKRNEVNMYNLMSSKISTIQALIEHQARGADSWKDLTTQEFAVALEKISGTTKSDISFFTPDGKVFRSTAPEIFEKMIIGNRMDPDAFFNICQRHQRFYINRSKVSGISLWTLYAPIFNDKGDLIAIINTPYTDRSFDFRREAQSHAAMIVNLFLLLLIGSLLFSTREVNSMFAPLVEMGKKMTAADINSLEYIIYKRDDEISSLVDAYNRMVRDLSDSTRQLAQAERDNAWSQMARQVAHEIKNPLTPIKLELQRLIRLKQKNNPAWEEKFDKVSAVILEHIDILTDTANEFSTFAKLYSEEPSMIDLDKVLKDQLMIFDNKENIRISYVGMEDALVMAPKPQLIRVFVNLITNAIQAVEIRQREVEAETGEKIKGKVMIFLRNSTKDGYYDIVVDDNGTGVKEENLSRLFTPNFTTKSGGTGLGLAICRNIIEKCNGEISYRRSFVLGGASFTVTIPMMDKA